MAKPAVVIHGGRVSCSAGTGASLAGIGFSVVAERAVTVVLAVVAVTTQFTAIHRCGSEGCLTAKGDIGCWSSNGVVDTLAAWRSESKKAVMAMLWC